MKFDSKRQPKVNPFTNPSWSNFVTNCFNSYLLLCLTKLLHEGLRNIFVYVELLLVHVNELLSLKKARLVFLQDRYTVPTGQVILLRLTNIDVLEMLSSPELLQRLAASISRAFRGPQVRPYIRAIFTSVSAKSDFTNRFFKTKTKG